MAGRRKSKKIRFPMIANRPGGRNPVDALYGAFSDGIHNKTDDECIEIVDRMRLAFEYLFKTLQVSSEDAKEFVRALNTVNTKGK